MYPVDSRRAQAVSNGTNIVQAKKQGNELTTATSKPAAKAPPKELLPKPSNSIAAQPVTPKPPTQTPTPTQAPQQSPAQPLTHTPTQPTLSSQSASATPALHQLVQPAATKAVDTSTHNSELMALRDLALRSKQKNSLVVQQSKQQEHAPTVAQDVEPTITTESQAIDDEELAIGDPIESPEDEEEIQETKSPETGSILDNPNTLIFSSDILYHCVPHHNGHDEDTFGSGQRSKRKSSGSPNPVAGPKVISLFTLYRMVVLTYSNRNGKG